MTTMDIISNFAGLLFIIGYFPYVFAVLRGDAKPSKASWVIWATLDTITLVGMYVKGTMNGQIIGSAAGAWIVFVLALMKGTPGWTKLDKMCLAGAVLGIALWQIFSNPVLGIMTSLSVVFIGSFPTFASAWRDPSQENRTAWTFFWLSCLAADISIPTWDLANAAQPIVFTMIESVMMYLLYIHPRIRAKQPEQTKQINPKTVAVKKTQYEETDA